MRAALDAVRDRSLTVSQKYMALARVAESTVKALPVSDAVQALRDSGVICDLYEGAAPFRPRYVVPDYGRFVKQGSAFLGLEPPRDLDEALASLLVLYRHVPSITGFPVYVGDLDALIEPFLDGADEDGARKAVRLFLLQMDRTLTDSFVHGDLGPRETRAGRLIIEESRKLKCAVPNLSLKYDPDLTPDGFALLAAECALDVAKPSFANHRIFSEDFRRLGFEDYAVVSCYNGLPKGGGSCTLVRLNLAKLAPLARDRADLLERALPEAVRLQLEYMDARVRFLVEESGFFESDFLVKEGLVSFERFTAMFGLVGLAECVDAHSEGRLYGRDDEADAFGLEIVRRISEQVAAHRAPCLEAALGRYLLHAQVGIDDDKGVSPGCRIPVGREPELTAHILRSAPFHKYFPSGIGDVFAFEPTARRNPRHLLDIAKGAMASGLRYFSAYAADADVVRITGYLVKRCDLERRDRTPDLQNSAVLGRNAVNNLGVLDRRVRP